MSTTLITTAGLTAAAQAASSEGAIRLRINSFQIGADIITPDESDSSVYGHVYTGEAGELTYQVINDNTVVYQITLDENVGPFDIGNLGLFLEGGVLFAIVALDVQERKLANDPPSSVGNRRVFSIPVILSNIATIVNFQGIASSEASLPFLATENDLPSAVSAPYTAYIIRDHTEIGTPYLAVAVDGQWYFSRYQRHPNDHNALQVPESLFGTPAPSVGDAVYFDAGTQTFLAADGTDASKGFFGLRGENHTVYPYGSVLNFFNYNLTSGVTYYAGTDGQLITTENDFLVGVALTSTSILVQGGFGSQAASLPSVAAETALPAASNAEFTAYVVQNHSDISLPAAALPINGQYYYTRANLSPRHDRALVLDAASFGATNPATGDAVYFDAASRKFEKADGLDASKGFFGIRGSGNVVHIFGDIYYQSGLGLTAGARYYANGEPNAGQWTTTENDWIIGTAISSDSILIAGGTSLPFTPPPTNALLVSATDFGTTNPAVGAGVYFDEAAQKFELSDGLDADKGFFGIRGADNYIYTLGSIYEDGSLELTPGTRYYAAGAGNAGSFTTTENAFLVGVAITATSILVLGGVQLETGQITDQNLANNAVTTSKIADNAVTLAHMEHATQGAMLYYSGANGTPSFLARGNAGQVMTMNADGTAPEWADINIAESSITTAKLVDGAITTAKIADDAVSLAKMAHGTAGDIIYYDSDGAPALLSVGTAGYVLKMNADGTAPIWGTNTATEGNTLEDLSITTAKLADDAVTLDKMEHGTRGDIIIYRGATGIPVRLGVGTSGQTLVVGESGEPEWATGSGVPPDDSVTTAKIQDNAVTLEKMEHGNGGDVLTYDSNGVPSRLAIGNNYEVLQVRDGALAWDKIQSESISTEAVDNSHIANNTITGNKIAGNAITSAKILNGNITTAKIADNAVTTIKILNGAVTTDKLGDNSITIDKLAVNSIGSNQIQDGAITQSKLANNSIITSHIVNQTITSVKIADGTITNAKLANNTITNAKILDDTITGSKIASNSITATHITDNSITGAKLQNNAVSESKIADNAVTLAKMEHGAQGDLLYYAGASGTPSRLSIGSAGDVLAVNAARNAPVWSSLNDLPGFGEGLARAWGFVTGSNTVGPIDATTATTLTTISGRSSYFNMTAGSSRFYFSDSGPDELRRYSLYTSSLLQSRIVDFTRTQWGYAHNSGILYLLDSPNLIRRYTASTLAGLNSLTLSGGSAASYGTGWDIAVSDNYIYVANFGNFVYVHDKTTGNQAGLLTLSGGRNLAKIAVSDNGEYLYSQVADGYIGVHRIHSPNASGFLGYIPPWTYTEARGLGISGDFLYTFWNSSSNIIRIRRFNLVQSTVDLGASSFNIQSITHSNNIDTLRFSNQLPEGSPAVILSLQGSPQSAGGVDSDLYIHSATRDAINIYNPDFRSYSFVVFGG